VGSGPAIVARDYVEMASRMMGHFERSLAISEQSMAIALERGHLFSPSGRACLAFSL
jgi:hypothetical protein